MVSDDMSFNNSKVNGTYVSTDEITVKDMLQKMREVWAYVFARKVIIIGIMVIGGTGGFFFAKLKKTKYIASTTFVLEGAADAGGSLLGQYAGLAALAGINLGSGGMFQGDNLLELYKSRSMMEKALLSEVDSAGRKYLLVDKFIRINKAKKPWKNLNIDKVNFIATKSQPLTRFQDSVLTGVINELNAKYLNVEKLNRQSSIVSVQVTAEDESFAKEFNEQIVKTVNDFYTQTMTKKSLENLAILQHQADSVRLIFNNAINQTVAVNDATPNLNPNRQLLRAPAQRSQFNADANRAILSQLVQNLEVAKITLRKETPLIQIIDKPVLPLEVTGNVNPIKWAFLGAFAFGFLAILFFLIHRFLKNIITN